MSPFVANAQPQRHPSEKEKLVYAKVRAASDDVYKCVKKEIIRIASSETDLERDKFKQIKKLSQRTKMVIYEDAAKNYLLILDHGAEKFCLDQLMPRFRAAFLEAYPQWIKMGTGILAKLGLMSIVTQAPFIDVYHNNFERHVYGHSDIMKAALEDLKEEFRTRYNINLSRDAVLLMMSACQAVDLRKWRTEAYHAHTPKHGCCDVQVRNGKIKEGQEKFRHFFKRHLKKALSTSRPDEAAFHIGTLSHMVQDLVYHHGITLLQHAGLSYFAGKDPDAPPGAEKFPDLPPDSPAGRIFKRAKEDTTRLLRHIAEKMRASRRKALFEWKESNYSDFERNVTADNVLGPQDIDEWEITKYIASSQLYRLGERDPAKELEEGTEFGLIQWDIDAILNGLMRPADR